MMTLKTLTAAATLALLTLPLNAAGSDDATPPTPTETTVVCPEGAIFDANSGVCVLPSESNLTDDQLYDIVRELAYAGRLNTASETLDQMSNQDDDRVLTYRGFIARVSGDFEAGEALYLAAITANPENILARSYLGQGYAAAGETELATIQLAAIEAASGTDNWPYQALSQAIETGTTFAY